MKLEIAEFPVKEIRLGRRFSYENQVLEVDERVLIDLVLQDPRIIGCIPRRRDAGREDTYHGDSRHR